MQTNLAETSKGTIRTQDGASIADPLANIDLSSIPKRWKVQYLDNLNNWIDAASFNEDSTRRDGTQIVPWDGHVELYYGIKVPEEYLESFNFISYLSASTQLPVGLSNGQAHIIGSSTAEAGELYIWDVEDQDWKTFEVNYGFSLLEDNDTKKIGIVNKLVNPDYYTVNSATTYRDIVYLKGLRVVVETMYGPNTTFDLIEMSPRLKVDMSEYTITFETNKLVTKSDSGLPVGSLVASTGQINLMNYDGAFNENNTNSLVYGLLKPNIKFDFYETVLNVDGYDKYIPISNTPSGTIGNSSE